MASPPAVRAGPAVLHIPPDLPFVPPPLRLAPKLVIRNRPGPATDSAMTTETLLIRRANPGEMPVVIGLIEEAATWLRTKGTDQWAKPWPSLRARNERVRRGLAQRKTWLVEDAAGTVVATVTFREEGNHMLWSPQDRLASAVYISRLVVKREYAGLDIGGALIDWVGLCGLRAWRAQWIRIDVWTTNVALHNYYEKRGFRSCGICPLPEGQKYPSAALFQKPTAEVDPAAANRFRTVP